MSVVTKSINSFSEDVEQYLIKLNGALTNPLVFIVKKKGTNEIKTYESKIVKRIMYSVNFKCYLFFMNFGTEREVVSMIESFDVIGDVN